MKQHNLITNAANLVPRDPLSLKILQDRADYFAQVKTEDNDKKESISYIRFRLGKTEFYGIPYLAAKEVMHDIKFTEVPNTPHFIAGVMNWRGILLTILDLN